MRLVNAGSWVVVAIRVRWWCLFVSRNPRVLPPHASVNQGLRGLVVAAAAFARVGWPT